MKPAWVDLQMDEELERKAQAMLALLGFGNDQPEAAKIAALRRLVFNYLEYYVEVSCRNLEGVSPEHEYSPFVLRRTLQILRSQL